MGLQGGEWDGRDKKKKRRGTTPATYHGAENAKARARAAEADDVAVKNAADSKAADATHKVDGAWGEVLGGIGEHAPPRATLAAPATVVPMRHQPAMRSTSTMTPC